MMATITGEMLVCCTVDMLDGSSSKLTCNSCLSS